MDRLFRGYIETRGKQAIEKFKNRTEFKTYEQVNKFKEFAGVIAEDIILVDVDDYEQSEILMTIVEDLQLQCRVYETTRGKHFYFRNRGVTTCKTHTKTACGLICDMKLGSKNSYDALKVDGKERVIIFDKDENADYDELPKWLTPVKHDMDFLNMEAGSGRNDSLFKYILTLQRAHFTKEEIRECIRIINDYVLKEPLDKDELDVILRDEAFIEEDNTEMFFNSKGAFLFDEFAKFLINEYHIIKIDGQLFLYKDGIYIDGREEIESLMIKHISSLNRQKRGEVMTYINLLVRKNTEPSDANYIAFRNGIYDLEREELLEFSPNYIITNKIDYNYNPNAYNKITDTALNNIACGDKNIRMLLEEAIGYCFYRRNELRKAFILTGDKRNGKSTYLDMIQNLLGDKNTSALDLKELGDRFKTAEIHMKLANIGDDIGDEFIANPSIFKKLVSGNRIIAERKGQDPFEFNSYAKQLFSANDIPRIRDRGAVVDRLITIPFNAKFDKNDKDYDPFIVYKLKEESSMEYLIVRGLIGLKRVLANNGFTVSEKAQKELEEYEENNNPILMFFKEFEDDDFENQPTKIVYQKYNEFCLSNNLQPLSNVEFSKQTKKYFGYEIVTKSIKGKKYRTFVRV